jgi:hypothetical protein
MGGGRGEVAVSFACEVKLIRCEVAEVEPMPNESETTRRLALRSNSTLDQGNPTSPQGILSTAYGLFNSWHGLSQPR